jgi:NAD-dependent dihydropyrimidine dehydrogenase PreA subunit
MAYVIAEPCINVKDTACVDACPVDCIHPRKNEADFARSATVHRSGGVYRLRSLRSCLPGVSNLCLGGLARQMEALRRAEHGPLCPQVIGNPGRVSLPNAKNCGEWTGEWRENE